MPNVHRANGMTIPRLLELVALDEDVRRQAMVESGMATNAAMSEKPGEALEGLLRPPERQEAPRVSAQLRAPRKRGAHG